MLYFYVGSMFFRKLVIHKFYNITLKSTQARHVAPRNIFNIMINPNFLKKKL